MREIRITPPMQLLMLLTLLGLVGAAVAVQAPEVQRYLKVRSM